MSRLHARPWLGTMSLVLYGLLAMATHAHAAEGDYRLGTQGEVLDDRVMYTIGGGSAAGSPSSLYRPNGLGVGASWRANMMCGNMSLTNTLQNQLNGFTEGFQQIMGSVVQNATQAVMSLPALIIQRANPGLYELLSNGVMQGRIDFDRSKLTCQAMAEKMADKIGQAGWGALAKNQEMQGNLEQTGGDAVAAVKNTETHNGNKGVSWVGGSKAGGNGQTPIRVTSDVVRAGYNLLHNRTVDDSASISSSDCLGGAICQTWASPQEESEWAVRVLGESEIATCDSCETLRATAGSGLTPLIQETYNEHLKALQGMLSGSLQPTPDNLAKASSSMLPVTRGVIEALRDDPDQELLARRLASETALSSVLDKALLLLRTLLAGSHEPNIASAEPAQTALAKNIDTLEREIRLLQAELQVRQMLATNTASLVLDRHAGGADASRTVEQGDPEPGRLNDADARRK
ncbi:integrating conjugative element protein [Pseudomonas sp. ChxA]|uniref:Integrating conjugative element protein n=1 Tax=Pseudomonas fluorescens TaxID=294 RepID=A0A2T0HRT0_PSEFL|nr:MULTISPECIES: integrating conjugative element protein [Pseudomonas]AOA05096.1 integrating conjugative element protein [Pseudomonas sp. TMW 2.1634]MDL2185911.1 integrating conjugative element protein [Pseudomonas sp. ChxA]MQT41222.1 integrating conjugative element protein [Pseudomonas sp. FSL R10-0765]OOW02160.1 integrating conjugative element protein [Pseudomonas sp. MF6394]PRW85800.1 integrating conjugative element protein [Pseudomonas fluorescens]